MKVIKVQGTTKTGKTTTVEAVIRELRHRGYTVGSVKKIHYEHSQWRPRVPIYTSTSRQESIR